MGEWRSYQLGNLLTQYRNGIFVQNDLTYGQITISKHTGIKYRESKVGKEIGRKRQFTIDLKKYPHTLLFTRQGVSEGSIGFAPENVHGCIATENMPMFSVDSQKANPGLLEHWLKSDHFKKQIVLIESIGSAQKAIHERDLLKITINIPFKLEEQNALLDSLSEKEKGISQLKEHLEDQERILKKLRQTVLQEAVEGKLTADWRKQYPVVKGDSRRDGDALLVQIKADKERLVKVGNIRKEKILPQISDSDKPFELPEGWVWCRVAQASKQYVDCPHATPNYISSGYICLRAPNIVESRLLLDEVRYVSAEEYEKRIQRLQPQPNDLVYIREGGRLGIAGIINSDKPLCLGQRLMLVRFFEATTAVFIGHVLNSPRAFKGIVGKIIGAASPHVNVRDVMAYPIPLPPLAEQQAIVSRVENLMTTIDALEAQVTERKDQAQQLMQAVLREAFANGG